MPGPVPKGQHVSYEPPAYGSPPPPPPGGGGGYGGPPPGGGGYGAGGFPAQPQQQTSVLAIISLVTGILGILCCVCYGGGALFGIAGLITGFLGKKEIADSGGAKKGDGLALAGMICGGIGVALSILWWVLFAIGASLDYGYDY